ncbi:MAG: alanine:cation symporter family protein [Clostridia bacterium]|nr:alanine:cation symporter family protein [Clostridia bacterium]
MIGEIIEGVNGALYGFVLIILLVASGIYFTVRTRFSQFRSLGEQLRAVTEKPDGKGGVSSFQALTVSTASRVGTGNIVGVASAICLGGFGAVFWMWVIAIIGGATAFVESTLAQIYKKRSPGGGYYGGPAYYIEQGLHSRTLGLIFSVFLILTYGVGFNMLTSYNLQATFKPYSFYDATISPWIIGAVTSALVGYCLLGGGKRIIKTIGVIVPVMGIVYILVALVVSLVNFSALGAVISGIFANAFDFKAIFGGFGGSCLLLGVKRGLFSNEAGVGSAPNASAAAEVSHPVKQGLVQVLSVFIDTLLVCSATAFMCMTSGVDISAVPERDGAAYVQMAMSATLGKLGPIFITVTMMLFAFTTILGNFFYVEQCLAYILGHNPKKIAQISFKLGAALTVLFGAVLNAKLSWGIADVTMGLMALINIPVILILGKYVFRALDDYEKQRRCGKSPEFRASEIGLKDTECW